MMGTAGAGAYGDRLRGVIAACWRAGLRVGEALALGETNLAPSRGAILIRSGRMSSAGRSDAAVRQRLASHQLRHAHAVEMAHEAFQWW